MKQIVLTVAVLLLTVCLSASNKSALDGSWWLGMTPTFKLGWVSGYAEAMDSAGTVQLARCASEMPLYTAKYPDISPKDLFTKFCTSDTQLDYDGIKMGQFVDGIDTFYKDFRNRQLDVGWAIQYVRDQIKGKSSVDLEAEVSLWRRCAAAYQTGNTEQIMKACDPDVSGSKK